MARCTLLVSLYVPDLEINRILETLDNLDKNLKNFLNPCNLRNHMSRVVAKVEYQLGCLICLLTRLRDTTLSYLTNPSVWEHTTSKRRHAKQPLLVQKLIFSTDQNNTIVVL